MPCRACQIPENCRAARRGVPAGSATPLEIARRAVMLRERVPTNRAEGQAFMLPARPCGVSIGRERTPARDQGAYQRRRTPCSSRCSSTGAGRPSSGSSRRG